MKIQEFLDAYRRVESAGFALLHDNAKKQLSQREYERTYYATSVGPASDFGLTRIDDDGLTFSVEYNDACGCHPEHNTAYVRISWIDIEEQLNAV